jgi:hypothetical protein
MSMPISIILNNIFFGIELPNTKSTYNIVDEKYVPSYHMQLKWILAWLLWLTLLASEKFNKL